MSDGPLPPEKPPNEHLEITSGSSSRPARDPGDQDGEAIGPGGPAGNAPPDSAGTGEPADKGAAGGAPGRSRFRWDAHGAPVLRSDSEAVEDPGAESAERMVRPGETVADRGTYAITGEQISDRQYRFRPGADDAGSQDRDAASRDAASRDAAGRDRTGRDSLRILPGGSQQTRGGREESPSGSGSTASGSEDRPGGSGSTASGSQAAQRSPGGPGRNREGRDYGREAPGYGPRADATAGSAQDEPEPWDPRKITIGLWGPPQSGKTTYLAALQHATQHTDGSVGTWTIFPENTESKEIMINWSHQLVSEQSFPDATDLGVKVPLRWRFKGDLRGSRFQPRWQVWKRAIPSEFELDLIDVSGEAFGFNPAERNVSPEVVQSALDHLTRARGLIFLFDPITERHKRTAADYLSRTLIELAQRVEQQGRTIGQYLPHYIAICITKFDDPEIFQLARDKGLVNRGPDNVPRVLDTQAKDLFDALCDGSLFGEREDRGYGGAMFVRDQLRTYFSPDRIRYFVTSAIGFRQRPGWDPDATRPGHQIDLDDYEMVIRQGEKNRIRGPITPINVLEPLIALRIQLTDRG